MSTVGECRHESETTAWDCSRKEHPNSDFCIFHTAGVETAEDLRDELLRELHDAEPHDTDAVQPRYIDAKFGTLNLSHTELAKGCPFPIDFRFADLEALLLTNSEVIRPLHIQNTTISSPTNKIPLKCNNTLFRSEFRADGTTLKGTVDLTSIECRRTISFEDADIYGDLVLDGAQIDGDLSLVDLEISGDLHVKNVTVGGNANLKNIIVNGSIHARGLNINGDFCCDGALLAPLGKQGRPIDFSHLFVNGTTTFDDATFESAATFANAELNRPLRAENIDAKGDLEFRTANVHSCHLVDIDTAKLSIEQTDFADKLTIEDSNIKRLDCTGASILGDVTIAGTVVDGRFLSEDASFGGRVEFEEVQIRSDANFSEAEFLGRVTIDKGRYKLLDIERATFHDQFRVHNRVWLNRLAASRTHFEGDILFDEILCSDTITLDDAIFRGTVEIDDVRIVTAATAEGAYFGGRVVITESSFGAGLSLRNSVFDARLRITSLTASDAGVVAVDLAHAKIESGDLCKSSSGEYTYDFTHATLGDVRLDTDSTTFGDARIHQTTFDTFNFSSYRNELEKHCWNLHDKSFDSDVPLANPDCPHDWLGWRILYYVFTPLFVTVHTLAAGRRIANNESSGDVDYEGSSELSLFTENSDPTISEVESVAGPITIRDVEEIQTTYLKVKNGANREGATKIASEFFLREMHYRQVVHALKFYAGPRRGTNFLRWAENGVLRTTAGYGERVKRVIGSAGATIVLFALLFYIMRPPEVRSFGDALTISSGSFVTLIFSDTPQLSSQVLQLAATIEGFFGGLFIALLVFTLTRSIHR